MRLRSNMTLSNRDVRMMDHGRRAGLSEAAGIVRTMAEALRDGKVVQPDPARAVLVAAMTLERMVADGVRG